MNAKVSSDKSIGNQQSVYSSLPQLASLADLLGRIGLVAIFLISGIGKISAYEATAGYMSSVGVPGALLPIVIAWEILAAIAVIVGWQTRWIALLLAGFSLMTAIMFHGNLGDQIQQIMFLKNIAIAGGFLLLSVQGAGRWSLDAKRGRR